MLKRSILLESVCNASLDQWRRSLPINDEVCRIASLSGPFSDRLEAIRWLTIHRMFKRQTIREVRRVPNLHKAAEAFY